jgi:predicted PurR-regulated permease PerM
MAAIAVPPHPPAPVVVPRWVQLVALPLAALGLYEVAKAAGPVLLLFVVAAVVALILHPLVSAVQRARLPRSLSILVVYAGFAATLVAAGLLLAGPIANQVEAFQADLPSIVQSANDGLLDLQERLGEDVQIVEEGQTALQSLQETVLGGTNELVSFGTDVAEQVVAAGFGLVLIIVLSIYMLFYASRIGEGVRRAMPPSAGGRDDYPSRVVRAVAGYVRGQVLFSLAMGTGAGVGLYLLGVLGIFPAGQTYAVAFGAFFGVMELVPYVGPILGALPPILVALFQDPITAVWLGIFFTALQQLEGHIVAPLIFSATLRMNPILVIFALLFGHELYGIPGALVALPVAAVIKETAAFLREHTVLEPWGPQTSPLADELAAAEREPAQEPLRR